MENILTLIINEELVIDIDSFSETLVNVDQTQHPEVYARIINLQTNLSFINNDLVINNISVARDGEIIWTSDKYTHVDRLTLDINNNRAEYTLILA